ncbi:MAG: patatin-like phospholipase family protein [Clostridia bacterium]|nr:patatin-like phospholipase family protein [Clostridia bacterium]
MMRKRKTLGLALGSGGSRGVAHIGFLQALEEAEIKPDYISGCSMGSIVGAAYASGVTPEQMRKAACSLRFFDLVDVTGKPGGVLDTRKMRKLLTHYIGDVTFDELKIPFTCVAVDMIKQQVVQFNKGNVLDAIVASSSIPAIFKPSEIDGMRLVDGNILTRVPVDEVKKMGADKVVAVDVLGKKSVSEKCPNAIVLLTEIVELMDNARTERYKKEHRNKYNLWLEPELGNMSQYSFKKLDFAYEQGYKLGCEYADRIKELL